MMEEEEGEMPTNGQVTSISEQSEGEASKGTPSPSPTMLLPFHCLKSSPKVIAYRNVFGTGIPYMFIFSSLTAVFILQSSLNDDQGLGLATLAIFNVVALIFGLFTSSVISLLGTKYSLIAAYCLIVVYLLTNFYPRWYTLVPGAICLGIGQPPILASVNVHLTTIAIRYAPDLNERSDHLIALFTGMATMFFKFANFPGNLATTIILFSERHSSDSEIIDTSLGDICNNTEVATLNPTYVYILISVHVFMAVVAIIITLLFMDHYGTGFKSFSISKVVKDPIIGTLKMYKNWKIYVLVLMMITDGFITSTVIGQISKYFVTDCVGVHWVALFSMAYGVCSATAGVITGRLVKWIPQFMMMYTFSIALLATVLFLIFWEREPSYIVAFVPIIIIGLGEGLFNSVPPTLIGMLFPDKKEQAYSVLRQGFAFGFIIGFTIALFVETYVNLWVMVGFIVSSLVTYSILIFRTQNRQQLLPSCCNRINYRPREKSVENLNGSIKSDEEIVDLLDNDHNSNETIL